MRYIFLAVILLVCCRTVSAQTSTMLVPTTGSNTVAISQQIIRIKFDKPLDSSSVWNRVPVNDTVHAAKSGIYILPSQLFDTLSSSPDDLRRSSLHGDVTIYDDSTLQLTLDSGQLDYGQTYKILVADVCRWYQRQSWWYCWGDWNNLLVHDGVWGTQSSWHQFTAWNVSTVRWHY